MNLALRGGADRGGKNARTPRAPDLLREHPAEKFAKARGLALGENADAEDLRASPDAGEHAERGQHHAERDLPPWRSR